MAIKFEDDKRDGDKASKAPAKPVTASEPVPAPTETEVSLPFAKPVRPEKKRKGR